MAGLLLFFANTAYIITNKTVARTMEKIPRRMRVSAGRGAMARRPFDHEARRHRAVDRSPPAT
ncbi:MAG: hypothetical protein Q7W02_22815 [Candidatus Rokubacteria bacterium]|nr:hypothetical protein [Candidatus Rokubacteria bacterium]